MNQKTRKNVKKSKAAPISTIVILIIIVILGLLGYFITENKKKSIVDKNIQNNTNNTNNNTGNNNNGNNHNNNNNGSNNDYEQFDSVNVIKSSDVDTIINFANSIEIEKDTTNYTGYYSRLNNVKDEDFLSTLTKIVNDGAVLQNYAAAIDVFKRSDIKIKDNQKYFYGMYDNKLYNYTWNGNLYNREHVWPNSRLGQNRVEMNEKSIASDYHNLRFIEARLNKRRNNFKFVDASGDARIIEEQVSFYPGDEQRGDTARILLYMAIKYPKLKLVVDPIGTTYSASGMQMGNVLHFLKWHQEDKVDDFEINRNDQIFKKQKNRNPFIDNPQLFKKALKFKLLSQFKKKETKPTAKIIKNTKVIYYKQKNYIEYLF